MNDDRENVSSVVVLVTLSAGRRLEVGGWTLDVGRWRQLEFEPVRIFFVRTKAPAEGSSPCDPRSSRIGGGHYCPVRRTDDNESYSCA